jgi:hypothetical protein
MDYVVPSSMRTRRQFSLAFGIAASFDGTEVTVADVLPRGSEFFPGLRSGRAIQRLSMGEVQGAFPGTPGQGAFDRKGRTDDGHARNSEFQFSDGTNRSINQRFQRARRERTRLACSGRRPRRPRSIGRSRPCSAPWFSSTTRPARRRSKHAGACAPRLNGTECF